jgi:hypothetical protein
MKNNLSALYRFEAPVKAQSKALAASDRQLTQEEFNISKYIALSNNCIFVKNYLSLKINQLA